MSKSVPRLRFQGFDGEWKEKTLKDITQYFNGKGHEENQKAVGKYELINLNSISINGGLKHSGKFIDDTDSTLLKNDLVMILSDVGHGDLLGRVALIPISNKYVLNQRVALLRPNEESNPNFLYSYINFHQKYFKSQGAGMSQLNISKGAVESFISSIPEIKEQEKIGSFFKTLDQLISLQEQKIALLKEQKKGFLQKLFPKSGAKVPDLRFAGFEGDWEERKLSEVSQYLNGGSYENDVVSNGSYELITLKSVNMSGNLVSSGKFINRNVKTLNKGTLVMILSEQSPGLLGMTAPITECNKYVLNQRVAEIRPNDDINSYFLSMTINKSQIYFSKKGAGTKVQNISKSNVENFEFYCPSDNEQNNIGFFLQQIDKVTMNQQRKLDNLKEQKKGLLQMMFI